jgi:NADPH:quinone reductase-like Zn-dependent oxidoreductase
MRVVTQDTVGGPERLHIAERPLPEPGEGEMLVRIAAAGINPVDLAVRAGAFALIGEPPFVLGWDIAGTVEKPGPGVSSFSPGDRVMGLSRFPEQAGAYADFACVSANEFVRTPANMTDAEAAGLPLAGLTAWQAFFDEAGLKPNDRVLVHAGAGGVGHLAIQIAKTFGAHVTTTVSAGKIDYVRSIGADEVIDYRATDFTEAAADIDIVLETIAGDHALESLKVLKPGGIVVCLKAPAEEAPKVAADKGVRLSRILVHPDAAALQKLAALAAERQLKVHVERTFALEDAGEAHRFLETAPIGKVVLAG